MYYVQTRHVLPTTLAYFFFLFCFFFRGMQFQMSALQSSYRFTLTLE
jgi:hypothetical protein